MGEDVGIGHGLHSFTQDVAIHSFRQRGRTIRLIDTNRASTTRQKADVNILNNIAFLVVSCLPRGAKTPSQQHQYLHPISEPKMVRNGDQNLAMMKLFMRVKKNLSVVWLATTMLGLVSPERELAREQELKSTDLFWGRSHTAQK